MKTSEFVFLHCFLEPMGKNNRIKEKTSNKYIEDTKGEHTWRFTTRIGGISPDDSTAGSSTKRAIWSIFRGDMKTSTPKGSNAAQLGALSFFLSLWNK